MNREIKFRAFAYTSKKMFYPDTDDGWEIKKGKLYELPNTILMQSTGLLDKNGKEIYRGDIVKINSPTQNGTIGEVIFERGGFCIKISEDMRHVLDYDIEVIGNIYENKL